MTAPAKRWWTMSRKHLLGTLAAFGLAFPLAAAGGWVGADAVERRSAGAVADRLAQEGLDWAEVRADGLRVILTGEAPSEPARFRAVTRAGEVVEAGRVVDAMAVAAPEEAAAPRFSLQLLRNDAGVSVIGLMPSEGGSDLLASLLEGFAAERVPVTNLVEAVDHAMPDGWSRALIYAMDVAADLPRSKLTVRPGHVSITAVADSDRERTALEARLSRARPRDVTLALDIAAPRPVVTPFTLRFAVPPDGPPRFEACAVDSEAARDRILQAASRAGFEGKAACVLALGSPSARWGEAVAAGIDALAAAGGGVLTVSDADMALQGPESGVTPAGFERIAADLEAALPEIFSLTATLPEPAVASESEGEGEAEGTAPEFTAIRSPEGQVQLRGRLFDDTQREAVLAYGRALFGVEKTYMATREDETLPEGWPQRVLAALDALTHLEDGLVVVRPDALSVRGRTGDTGAEAEISRLLAQKLGADAELRIAVEYLEELDPTLNIPTPEECEAELNAILAEQKLSFAPGEAVIDVADGDRIERLRAQLELCERSVFEVGGHTDSQGREVMNEELSQSRAEAVRAELIARGVPPSQLVAVGYGEVEPIADNATEEGREANRRIAFTLLGAREQGGRTAEAAAVDGPRPEETR
jgi:OOP family OmpA-OmpF porin